MNFRYGKREMEYLKSRDRRLGEITPKAVAKTDIQSFRTCGVSQRKSLFLDGRRWCHPRPHRSSRRNAEMNEEHEKLIGREFRHFKGNLYRLEGFAKDSETLEEMVVYRALYGEHGLWVRPAKMFFETIERDGKQMKRFELLEKPNAEKAQ